MKEDWLNKIKDRMSDFEIDEPAGLWDSIEDTGKKSHAHTGSLSDHKSITKWARRFTAAAALIALIAFIGIYLGKDNTEFATAPISAISSNDIPSDSPESRMTANASTLQFKSSRDRNEPSEELPIDSISKEKYVEIAEGTTLNPSPGSEPEKVKSDSDESSVKTSAEKTDDKRATDKRSFVFRKKGSATHTQFAESTTRRWDRRDNRFAVSLYGSGRVGTSQSEELGADFLPSDRGEEPEPDEKLINSHEEKADIGYDRKVNDGYDKLPFKLHHRIPIRVVAGFTYNITDRIGIETGISYVNLVSDFDEGYAESRVVGKQKLHYLGIPLNIKYRIYSWKRIEFYVSGGALWEKCLSSKIHCEYPGNRLRADENFDLGEKPMQWSVNAAAGIQCDLIQTSKSGFHSLSIFVEPGVGYYFNDGSSLKTIYKEKPFNFNLNLGIRLSFGR